MKAFVSYAAEQRELAQRIALALTGAEVETFLDSERLAPAGEFNLAIRSAIQRSDLFVFIASREALEQGSYTLTELGIAQRRWPHPAQRVLTLLADDTPIAALPPYLSAVTVLKPSGDLVAETVDAVARWREHRRRRRLLGAGASAGGVAAAALALWLMARGPDTPTAGPAAPEADIDGGIPNSRVYGLKNGRKVRFAGSLVRNESNVADPIIRKYIEWGAWRYNQCYDRHFGHLAGSLPEGQVDIGFEVIDQLPRHARVVQSDFAEPGFASCVEGTVSGQTLNAAGPHGRGKVLYRFRFLPN